MYERFKKSKRWLRSGAVMCLTALLLFPTCTGAAQAASVDGLSSARELVPVGHTVGIKLFSRGVLVVDLAKGSTPAEKCGMKKGDVILKCEGKTVASTEQFQSLLQSSSGREVELQVRRGGTLRTLRAAPEKNDDGVYAIGAWIRDSMAGIGTMTFYDPATGAFGALGHGITDPDTAQLMPFSSGSLLASTVKAVKQGKAGSAGELRGNFDLTRNLGELCANGECGIFGTLDDSALATRQAMPVAKNEEVKNGKATILSNVEGDEVRSYTVEIKKLTEDAADPRDLLVTVTDPALLKTTGGIVQGMSGSPILQNGKIVGAVTHVLLSDPTRGYGILIQNMLEGADPQVVENAS
ncbi:MAG: SpoIVB peptidase [Oscillibacter sp.]|nr:SpoIVB peptidase [Oscillibacter sp.]